MTSPRYEALTQAAEICEKWSLSPQNMNRVANWKGDWSNKVAGVCRYELPKAIIALRDAPEAGQDDIATNTPQDDMASIIQGELQAKIDALMLEYCPDEMTPEQIENWKRHQKAATLGTAALHARR